MGQFPQLLEALPPRTDIGGVVESQRAAWLVDMEAAHPVAFIRQQVRIRQVAQIVRALSRFDDMREANDEPHQAWRVSLQWAGVMQYHADSAKGAFLQKAGQGPKPGVFFESQGGKITIENQNLPFRPGQDGVAGLTILSLTGKQRVSRIHHKRPFPQGIGPAETWIGWMPGGVTGLRLITAIIIRRFSRRVRMPAMPIAHIESLDHEGRGVAHVEGKAIFIEGALPGELVEYASHRRKPSYEKAHAIRVLRASSQRVAPPCPHYGACGGCSMQHLGLAGQTAAKQRVLEDALWHIARLKPERIYAPIAGTGWGYRLRARLSVRHVASKGGALIGFRERHSSYVALMDSCAVLPPQVSALIPALKALVDGMSQPDRMPQIEVAVGGSRTVLVLRHLEALSADDLRRLRQFADTHGIIWYLQAMGLDSVILFHPADARMLSYELPDFGLELLFHPTEFTQVNIGVNRMLVRRAMALLKPRAGERIADLFCGLGNFTLPIARLGARVLGIEGSPGLVRRARANAAHNGLAERCEFAVANLFEATAESLAALGSFDKLLIDPPREGAVALVKALPAAAGARSIVYVSCSPATLARDAAVLVHEKGYRLCGAGIANMFPHTSHLESIALFEG